MKLRASNPGVPSSSKTHYSAAELALLRLQGLPGSKRGIEIAARNKNWTYLEVKGRGGRHGTRKEYAVTSLPIEARQDLVSREITAVSLTTEPSPVVLPAAMALQPALSGLSTEASDRLKKVEWARESLIAEIRRMMSNTGCSQEAVITTLLTSARAGTLESGKLALLRSVKDGRGRKSGDDLPTVRTIKRFLGAKKCGKSLIPAVTVADQDIKPWMILAFELSQNNPQGKTKRWIHEQIIERWRPELGDIPPSYDMVAKFFRERMSVIDQYKGKWTGSQLRSRTFYHKRSNAGMLPWDEIHADGWNTHFTAPHPVTGEYVTYEVWHAHDVATRYIPPFSIGLTENFEVIAKCVENAYRAGGCMGFLQTDSTKIVKNSERFKTNPATAIADRAGFTIIHPQTVGNSQANGIAENFNTWLDKESRELATYQNPKRMDELSFKRGRKLTAAMVKAAKAGDLITMHAKRRELERATKGIVFTSGEQAVAWLEEKRQKWNHKPHSSLPKTERDNNGRLRHQTPFEALMGFIDAGWEPSLPDLPLASLEQHMIDLFRPHVQILVRRGTVTPYGGMRYRHEALDQWLDKEVVVAYDMTDWGQVWVKTVKGEPICIAKFVVDPGYRTLSAKEFAEEKRAAARIRNKERQIEAELLAMPGLVIEHRPEMLNYLPAQKAPTVLEDIRLIDMLPAKDEERELTHMETVALFMPRIEDNEEGDESSPVKESAAG